MLRISIIRSVHCLYDREHSSPFSYKNGILSPAHEGRTGAPLDHQRQQQWQVLGIKRKDTVMTETGITRHLRLALLGGPSRDPSYPSLAKTTVVNLAPLTATMCGCCIALKPWILGIYLVVGCTIGAPPDISGSLLCSYNIGSNVNLSESPSIVRKY